MRRIVLVPRGRIVDSVSQQVACVVAQVVRQAESVVEGHLLVLYNVEDGVVIIPQRIIFIGQQDGAFRIFCLANLAVGNGDIRLGHEQIALGITQ